MSEQLRVKYVNWAWKKSNNGRLSLNSIHGRTLFRLRRMYMCSIARPKTK